MPDAVLHDIIVDLAKQGPLGIAVLVLGWIVVVLWKDNLRLRSQAEGDQDAREKRDDARFDEVRQLAEQSAKAIAQSSGASASQTAALENTNKLIEKQGDLIEARTALFQSIATSIVLFESALRAMKDTIDVLVRRLDR